MSMNRMMFFLGMTTLLAAVLSVQADLIPNADFEQGSDGKLASWECDRQPIPPLPKTFTTKRNVVVCWDNTTSAGDGKASLKMVADTTDRKSAYGLVASPYIPVKAGYKYDFDFAYKAQGLAKENQDRTAHCGLIIDLFFHAYKPGTHERGKYVGGFRQMTHTNSASWSRIAITGGMKRTFTVPKDAALVEVRIQLTNNYPNTTATAWVDDIRMVPQDPSLPNAGLEVGKDQFPQNWAPYGGATMAWDHTTAYSGQSSVRVTDAPEGRFTGWSTIIPVRLDRKYTFGAMIKGGDLNPNGFVEGGAVCMQFLDGLQQPVGEPVTSKALGAKQDWTHMGTPPATPPAGAVFARLTAGLNYCRGTAWFDDLSLGIEQVPRQEAQYLNGKAQPSSGVSFSQNMLVNGDVESGKADAPAGWTYHGQFFPNWTDKQIDRFHTNGRPDFSIGRGQGQWSRNLTYQGKGALLNISIDPPLSSRQQWYGRNPVDGYWLSDAMACEPGHSYLAAAWLHPGAPISGEWYGPLELKFYNDRGRELPATRSVRSPYALTPPNQWSYWVTLPWTAPTGAKTMRLRFGQELHASKGGWGRTYADNLAVWEFTPPMPSTRLLSSLYGNTTLSHDWLSNVFTKDPPPYMPSPEHALAYETCWGKTQNVHVGNLFEDPTQPIQLAFAIQNILGEDRTLSLKLVQTDWTGEHEKVIDVPAFKVRGYEQATVKATLPASHSFGSYHLDATILEDGIPVGSFDGRYAVMPHLTRKHTVENIWGVTSLTLQDPAENPTYYDEMGKLIQKAGFGIAWVRVYFGLGDTDDKLTESFAPAIAKLKYYRALGVRPVLQLCLKANRPLDVSRITQIGKRIATEFGDLPIAYGNWGIEQSNSASPYRGGGAKRVTDMEYDTILATLYDAIKSVDPKSTVLIGNIATDHDGKTVRRLYGSPAKGRFDGAIINAYMGPKLCIDSILQQFAKHSNNDRTIWYEEQSAQRSPFKGDARRYGEAEGAQSMVRTWLDLYGSYYPRLKAVSMWGFDVRGAQDIMMVTSDLQPRPQYVAHAVMSDALADATFAKNLSVGDATIFQWDRTDGKLLTCWTQAGQRVVTFEAPKGQLVLMDIMGNRRIVKATHGVAIVTISLNPVYILDNGNVAPSNRLTLGIDHATRDADAPQVCLMVTNNEKTPVTVTVKMQGPVTAQQDKPQTLAPGQQIKLMYPVTGKLPAGKRTCFEAQCTTTTGGVFATSADLNFAFAVHAATPPALDGTWKGWGNAKVLSFGDDPTQVRHPAEAGERYDGLADIQGKLRLMWDDQYLYLGVEALDNAFVTQNERGRSGFMGDSIEFAAQPDHLLKDAVPYYEYELYLPTGESSYAASRRFPAPGQMVANWQATVKPTGHRGDAVYQVALPWKDLGLSNPQQGRLIAFALVLNDKDDPKAPYGGGRCRIKWFDGIDGAKSPAYFGDVVLTSGK